MESIEFNIKNPKSITSKDISRRVERILKDMNVLSTKYEFNDHISYDISCLNDPNLEKIKFVFNIVNEYEGNGVESIATLETVNHKDKDSSQSCDDLKKFIISEIDETKSFDTYNDVINLFKSEFDFGINYDTRDIGYLLAYLTYNKKYYEGIIFATEKKYEDYATFCTQNYLNNILGQIAFEKKIINLCSIVYKTIEDIRVKRYRLSKFGKSCLNDPEIYYDFLKREEDKINQVYCEADPESFNEYIKENKDSYIFCKFTKLESYEDYEKFCDSKSYQPIAKTTFYDRMLNNCVVKRSKDKGGSECFIFDKFQHITSIETYVKCGIPDNYSENEKNVIQKQIDIFKQKEKDLEVAIYEFIMTYYHDFISFKYTCAEAFELYEKYCRKNNTVPIIKIAFYKEMRKHCYECLHKPSSHESSKKYFIIRHNEDK